jgi:radical SAM protein with 4Fe4S-binding SPASM domain
MSDDTFNKLITGLTEFPVPVKQVGFAGMGEPLMHEKIAQMVETLKVKLNIKRVSLITNGVLLSNSLSDDLINAGLDHIKISVNGLSDESFKANCGVKVDFNKYIEQIAYYYSHKKPDMRIECKILDTCLSETETPDTFYRIFDNICDRMSLERTVNAFQKVEYDKILRESYISRYDIRKQRVKICASPFFRMALKPDGSVTACRLYIGLTDKSFNIHENSLLDIWNSPVRKEMLLNVIDQNYTGMNAFCADCTLRDDFAFDSDVLDDHIDEIRSKIM